MNEWVYNDINNGVYKSGFAVTQDAYEKAVKPLSEALGKVEKILSDGREFLVGGKLTEADVRWVQLCCVTTLLGCGSRSERTEKRIVQLLI